MSKWLSVIFVVVDHFTKYVHFMVLAHPYIAQVVVENFIEQAFKLYGFPKSVVSNRDPIFLNSFWRALFQSQGSSLDYSSSYHPQMDNQTEVVNKCIEGYLRCYAGVKPKLWSQWLTIDDWWYNTTYRIATKMTPLKLLRVTHP